MQIFENRRLAIFGMAALILISLFVGAARALSPLRSTAEQAFYNGVEGDGYGIENDLSRRAELAYNLTTVAKRYMDADAAEITALLDARDALNSAAAVSEKYDANDALTAAADNLYTALGAFELSDADVRYRESIRTDLRSRNETIRGDGYNGLARKYNERLSSFPVSLFGRLLGFRTLELFA